MHRVLRVLLLAALVAQGVIAVRATTRQAEFRSGVRAYRAGRVDEALGTFVELRRQGFPDHRIGAWVGDAAEAAFGSAPADSDRYRKLLDAAWEGYAFAVLRCPSDSWSWSGLAEVALRRAEMADQRRSIDLSEVAARARGVLDPWHLVALGAAKLATSLKPSGYQELDVLASVYRGTGNVAEAMKTYEASARMMPAPSFHSWGEVPVPTTPLYQALLRGVEEGIHAAPTYEWSLLNREAGKFVELNGDRDRALTFYEAARKYASDDAQTFYADYEIARLLVAMRRYDEALSSLREAEATGVAPQAIHRLRASALTGKHDPSGACVELLEVLRDQPNSPDVRLEAARACDDGGEPDLAERILREGFVLPSSAPRVARALLAFYVGHGKRETARNLLRTWERDDPDMTELAGWGTSLGLNEP